jgi:hypothetical protein
MRNLVDRANLIEQAFESIGGRQNGNDPRNQKQRNQYVLERETILKKQSQQEADRELKQDAAKREKNRVLKRLPKRAVRQALRIIAETNERHVTTNISFYGGVTKAQGEAVQDRINKKEQAKNCDWQNE